MRASPDVSADSAANVSEAADLVLRGFLDHSCRPSLDVDDAEDAISARELGAGLKSRNLRASERAAGK